MLSQRFLGSPQGKLCKSPGKNVSRKIVSSSEKKNFLFIGDISLDSTRNWKESIEGKLIQHK